ncbi:chromosome partitioning protein, ParB family [Azospirillum oryzae]|uniref:Chromosome partitioning protein, ParB family n=1 Tax=Azospirillum oryzae TaxID=286727 RepID=A0A1X7ET20_9PROT|nr:ParB/RepB/Spo0J family partition protein [Azospirillum oryzae]SMF39396.1 chromosome partitioning protein, ParB family [Azospirillum oryzae]
MHTAAITSPIVEIALSKLVSSKQNVRKTGGQTLDQLAANIEAKGLIHNLAVVPVEKDGKPTGKFAVVAGGRRLAALKLLAKRKRIPAGHPIPCTVRTAAEAVETSLAENVIREAMHPADEFEAFRVIIDQEGATVEEVAARFGVEPLYVSRRLRLAQVSPKLLDLYRTGKLTAAHMQAFALSDSHAAQEAAYFEAPEYRRDPQSIRSVLTHDDVKPMEDRRARFITADAYLAAGGTVRQDLFAAPGAAPWTDAALVERLALEKLETVAAQVRAEGWKWVEVQTHVTYERRNTFARVHAEDVPLSEADAAELERLEQEYDALAEQDDADPAALAALDEQMQTIRAREDHWSAEKLAIAGALVSLDYQGAVQIDRGMVRPEDERAIRQGAAEQDSDGATESTAGARKPMTAALMLRLTAQRTMALRAELMERPDVALVAIVHNLMAPVFYGTNSYSRPSALEISVDQRGRAAALDAEGIEGCAAKQAVTDRHGWWLLRIPAAHHEAWEWLMEQDQETILSLLAYCTAQTVNAVRHPHNTESDERLVASNDLAASLGLDMAKWWEPTAETYLASVPKDAILDAVREGVSPEAADNLANMKKAALVAEAELRLAGSGWLPVPLRSHLDQQEEEADQPAAQDDGQSLNAAATDDHGADRHDDRHQNQEPADTEAHPTDTTVDPLALPPADQDAHPIALAA